eukprot:31094-Pelagococcus_subviridis.AAC.4
MVALRSTRWERSTRREGFRRLPSGSAIDSSRPRRFADERAPSVFSRAPRSAARSASDRARRRARARDGRPPRGARDRRKPALRVRDDRRCRARGRLRRARPSPPNAAGKRSDLPRTGRLELRCDVVSVTPNLYRYEGSYWVFARGHRRDATARHSDPRVVSARTRAISAVGIAIHAIHANARRIAPSSRVVARAFARVRVLAEEKEKTVRRSEGDRIDR